MPVTLTNVAGLPQVDLYHQVAVASGTRLVFLAGQVSVDADGALVGEGDLAAQVAQCCVNVATALAQVGATLGDVAKLTVYVVGLTPQMLPSFAEGTARAAERLGLDALPLPPLTGIGVASLADPGYLVEIEATAVLG